MNHILVVDDEAEIRTSLEDIPVSYTHLDVYKRQAERPTCSPTS